MCKANCNPLFQYNFRCVHVCPVGYFANANYDCVVPTSCDTNTYGDNATTTCVATCPSASFADPISRYCIAVCPDNYFGDNKVCVQNCNTASTTASNITQLCSSNCPNYTYSHGGHCYSNCSWTGNLY